jgi:hypothetical protein
MSKLIGLLFSLVIAAPQLAHAGKLVPVTPAMRAKVIRAVNQARRDEGGKGARGMTVLINNRGRGLAFYKSYVGGGEIANPYAFTIKNGKVSYPLHLYAAALSALKGNF